MIVIRQHAGRSGAIFGPGVFARVMGRLDFRCSETPVSRPVQFIPAFKASGSLFLGNARFQACQQSSRRFANPFQVEIPLRGAALNEEKQTTGRIPDDGKSTAQSRNLTARDGNYAC